MRIIAYITLLLFSNVFIANSQTINVNPIDPAIALKKIIDTTNSMLTYKNVYSVGKASAIGWLSNGYAGNLEIDSGLVLSNGWSYTLVGMNTKPNYTDVLYEDGDSLILALSAPGKFHKVYDATGVGFEFITKASRISFQCVFASEEYPEWVADTFNDMFAVFIIGPGFAPNTNVAVLPDGTPITVKNINATNHSYLYIDNYKGANTGKYLQADGYTKLITFEFDVVPCEWYKIYFVISDVGDPAYNSWVILNQHSFTPVFITETDTAICISELPHHLEYPYTIYPGSGFLWNTGQTTSNIEITTAGQYWVNNIYCDTVVRHNIYIPEPISNKYHLIDTILCTGETVTFEVKTTASERYWEYTNTSQYIFSDRITLSKPGTLIFHTSNTFNCSTSDTFDIKLKIS